MQGTEAWRFLDGDRMVSVNPPGRFKANDAAALAAAAAAGVGIAYLPDFVIEEHLASGALTPIMARFPVPEAGLYVVRPPGAHPARKIRALIEILIEYLGERTSRGRVVRRQSNLAR
jgi:DNA-binding transcriptional LysR family regulator